MSASQPFSFPHIGVKFNADGSVRRYPGNTIICHASHNAVLWSALLVAHNLLTRSQAARHLAFLPPESYHMTVFEGATEHDRVSGLWPTDVPLDAPLDTCTRMLEQKLIRFDPACTMPLRMRVADASRQDRPGMLVLTPIDDDENRKLRGLRDNLSEQLLIRSSTHEKYIFHITLAYQIERMTPKLRDAFLAQQSAAFAFIKREVPVIELGPPEFCTFENMHAFHTRTYLVPDAPESGEGVQR